MKFLFLLHNSYETESEDEVDSFEDKPNYRQRKARKSGLTSVEIQKILDTKDDPGRRYFRDMIMQKFHVRTILQKDKKK